MLSFRGPAAHAHLGGAVFVKPESRGARGHFGIREVSTGQPQGGLLGKVYIAR